MVSTTTWLQPREYKSPYYTYRCLSVLIEQFRNSRHDIPVSYPTMHHWEQKCAHFCSQWCIVGYGTGALWDLQISCLSSALCKETVKESRPGATQCNERIPSAISRKRSPYTWPQAPVFSNQLSIERYLTERESNQQRTFLHTSISLFIHFSFATKTQALHQHITRIYCKVVWGIQKPERFTICPHSNPIVL